MRLNPKLRPFALLLSARLWRRRVATFGGAVLVALVALAFARAADAAQDGFAWITDGRPLLVLLLAPGGLALSVWLTRRVFPGAQGSGIPQVIAALHMDDARAIGVVLSLRIAVGKILLTLLGLLCGASIGREGPTVQVGASIMNTLGRVEGLPASLRRSLVLAGGAAGVAAAFNTPIAGVVFAIEELSHSFETRTSGTVLTAVILGGITTFALAGNYNYFGVSHAELTLHSGWAAVLLCALLGGAAGGLFSWVLVTASGGLPGRAGRMLIRHPIAFAALCGLALALLGLATDGATYGTGYAQARGVVEGTAALPPFFAVAKLLATVVSYLSGIPGGIFAPSLAVGAGIGEWLAHVVPWTPESSVVLLGMVAYFAGVVQAPITATVIVMEMTADQRMTIPLLATSMLAYAVSRLICRRPLYGALAMRFLAAQQASTVLDRPATPMRQTP
jgi:H+/Cl- antiporter ClcA